MRRILQAALLAPLVLVSLLAQPALAAPGFHAAWVDQSPWPVLRPGAAVAYTIHFRNTGTETGNLLLKLRLNDNRNRSFNMVNPRDRYILGDLYADALSYLRSHGVDAIGPDAVIRPSTTASVYMAFLAAPDASTLRLVPDNSCG